MGLEDASCFLLKWFLLKRTPQIYRGIQVNNLPKGENGNPESNIRARNMFSPLEERKPGHLSQGKELIFQFHPFFWCYVMLVSGRVIMNPGGTNHLRLIKTTL